MGNVIDGLLVGALSSFVPKDAFWGLGKAIPAIGVGWFRNNPTLQSIGGLQVGQALLGHFTGGGGVSGNSGGGWL